MIRDTLAQWGLPTLACGACFLLGFGFRHSAHNDLLTANRLEILRPDGSIAITLSATTDEAEVLVGDPNGTSASLFARMPDYAVFDIQNTDRSRFITGSILGDTPTSLLTVDDAKQPLRYATSPSP